MSLSINSGLKHVSAILVVGFVLAIGYALAEITWLALDDRSDVDAPRQLKPLLSSKAAMVNDFYGREIAGWNLFGVVTATKKAADKKVEVKAPDTRLQLVLKGVYVAPNVEKSSAIIADKSNAKRYRIGEKVPGGVSLHEVQNKFVILKRGAKYETLRFTESSLKAPITAKPRAANKAPRRGAGSERRGIVNDIRSGKITSVRDILNDYGANPAEQFAAVLMEAGMEPTNDDGESGLKVGANAPKDILKSIGLRSGDIVRSVNDFPVNELQGDDALLREILTSKRAKIVIQRGSRRFTVNYPLPQG
jgi:general secretion pathway protein C